MEIILTNTVEFSAFLGSDSLSECHRMHVVDSPSQENQKEQSYVTPRRSFRELSCRYDVHFDALLSIPSFLSADVAAACVVFDVLWL